LFTILESNSGLGSTPREPPQTMNGGTILLIDDDETILAIFSASLQTLGYTVFTASDGASGLEKARKHLPEVILSDINMPGTDGKTFLRKLREDPALGTTQVVLMTGQAQATSRQEGMFLGADDFLYKPFGFEVLKQCVESRLRRARIHWRVEENVLNELRGDLSRSLPHEFFTPLSGIIGLADFLKPNWQTLEAAEVDELLQEIILSGWRLQRTLRNYLWTLDGTLLSSQASANGSSVPALSPEQACEVLREQAAMVCERHSRDKDLVLDLEATPMPGIARGALEVVVSELVDNACAFSHSGTSIEVCCSSKEGLTIRDHGRGMTIEHLKSLRTFHQIDREKHEQQGLGIGLSLVGKLLDKAQASFTIESEPGQGTFVVIHFAQEDKMAS